MVRIIKKVGFFLSDCQRWKKPTFGSFLALYGAKVGFHRSRPKVGFHFWKVGFSPLVGFRTAKGGLPCLEGGLFVSLAKGGLKRPNLGFSSGRWAFPCLTVFRTARRLNLSLYGAKVGFHASKDPEYCQDCQRWASMVPKVGFEASKVGLFPVLPKVGFEGGLFGLIWLILAFSLESYLLYILYTL